MLSTDDVIHLSVATGDDVSRVFVRFSSCVFLNSTIQAGGSSLLLLLPGEVTERDAGSTVAGPEEMVLEAIEEDDVLLCPGV